MQFKIIISIFSFLFLSFFASSQNASETYQATTQLNIRSGVGTAYEVVGSISQGDKVLIDTIISGWGRVVIDGEAKGFASMKFLTTDLETTLNELKSKGKEEDKGGDSTTLVFLIIGALILVLYIVYNGYNKRCKSCGKWYAMKITDEEVVEKVNAAIKKTTKERNSKGETIRTNEVYIPATKTKYLVTETCEFCGHEERYHTSETKEN